MQCGDEYIERCQRAFKQRCEDSSQFTHIEERRGLLRIDILRGRRISKVLSRCRAGRSITNWSLTRAVDLAVGLAVLVLHSFIHSFILFFGSLHPGLFLSYSLHDVVICIFTPFDDISRLVILRASPAFFSKDSLYTRTFFTIVVRICISPYFPPHVFLLQHNH
ncbi:hypothetical protein BDZ97DRAFT_1068198 [Flammula alnicola]|nr:hypothetical protein BDZ97DRAFT_1068198 [Flammula alnicola]